MKLKEIRNKKGISQKALADALGVSRSLVAMWETGRSSLNATDAKRMADYFNVSLDYLIGEKEIESSEGVMMDEFAYAMYEEGKGLNDESKKKILEMAKFFKQQQEKDDPD